MYSGVFVFFFCFFKKFSTQNQEPQIVIGLGCVIYHVTALSVAIQTTVKNVLLFPSVEEKGSNFFDFFVLFRASTAREQAY